MKKIIYLAPLALLGMGVKVSANQAPIHISNALMVLEEQQNKQASSTQQVGTAETGQTKQSSLPAPNLPNDQAIKKNGRLNATHISRLDSSFIFN